MKRLGASLALTSLLSACMTQQVAAPIDDRGAVNGGKPIPPAGQRSKAGLSRGSAPSVGAPASKASMHVVQRGDTLFNIAFQNGLDYQALARANGLTEPYLIFPGQRLQLRESAMPAPGVPSVPKETATANPTSGRGGVDALDPDAAPARWVWPVRGPIVTEFNEQAGAKGLDIGGRHGTPVVASAPGRVVYAGSGLRGYGKLVIIKHSTALLSAYGHHASLAVKEGDRVVAGQVIGTMGDTDADQVKLHFEIREFGKPVDPRNYLPAQG